MGAYSTSPTPVVVRDDAEVVGSRRTAWSMAARIAAALVLIGGIVGAVFGIVTLHVETTVVGLILAFTSGLVLLKLRTATDESA